MEKILALLEKLRSPNGCAWNRAQSFSSLRNFLHEEFYECAEALEDLCQADQEPAQAAERLCEELGDLLLQVAFLTTIAEEEKLFTRTDVEETICQKLIRRHPHVFGGESAETPEEVARLWEKVKALERKRARKEEKGALSGVPRRMPALSRAQKIGEKAAGNGFDWAGVEGVLEKIEEEIRELKAEIPGKDSQRIREESGDLLFAVTNLARFQKFSAEESLHEATDRFQARYHVMEKLAQENDQSFADLALDKKEKLWNQAKELLADNETKLKT